jgi:hypothetical protein
MTIDESTLEGLPLKVRLKVLRAIAEAAAYGVSLQIATGEDHQRLMTRERVRRFRGRQRVALQALPVTLQSVTSNVTERYEPPAETPKNPAISQVTSPAVPRARASQISDQISDLSDLFEISEIREDQRESACVRPREATIFASQIPEPKKLKTKDPKPVAWRRVPSGWMPNDQHRAIAAECCVPFELELAKYRDHEFNTPKRDPDATFRNWLRSARSTRPTPYSAAPLPPPAPRIKYSSREEIYRALGRA